MHPSAKFTMLFTIIVLAVFAFSFAPNESASQTSQPTKWALLVGINDYRHNGKFADLDGCVNDVQAMKALLIGKFEFPEKNILVLTDAKATRAAIIAAFRRHLIANAGPGDIVVFHYSGHGSQMDDVSGDESDGLDETIVPHDSRDPEGKVFDISDDEINGLLRELSQKKAKITFIFDSCNSGTVTRGPGKKRQAPKDERMPPQPAPGESLGQRGVSEGKNDLRPADLDYVLISACVSKQSASEHYVDTKAHGALTYFLSKELSESGAGATYRDVMDRVKGNVNVLYSDQLPQLEGADLDRYVFSDSSSIAQAYILASPLGTDRVKLEAGRAQGLTDNSIFAIYKPGVKSFEDTTKAITKVILTKVESFSSEGKIIQGKQIAPFSRAVEIAHRYPDLKLLLYFDGIAASRTLKAIKAKLAEYQHIETRLQPTGYHLLLRERNREIVTEWPDTTVASPPVPIGDSDAVEHVVQQITAWAKWFNLLSLDNSPAGAKISLTIDSAKKRGEFKFLAPEERQFKEGEKFECIIVNPSRRELFFSILDLSTDGSVAVIHPQEGASVLLKRGHRDTLSFETFVPEDRDAVSDVIKVFATLQPYDFHLLTQPPVRGGKRGDLPPGLNDPLYKLLEQATLGISRGVRPAAVKTGDWATAERVFRVKR